MYVGRYAPKEGKNREKVTFHFVDIRKLTYQPCKTTSFDPLVRTRMYVRLPTAMLIFCCHKCHSWSIFGEGKQGKSEKKIRKSPKMQA